jgi:hypothetical protein
MPHAMPSVDVEGGVEASVGETFAGAGINKTCDLQPFVTRLRLHTTERYTTTEASLISTEYFITIEE